MASKISNIARPTADWVQDGPKKAGEKSALGGRALGDSFKTQGQDPENPPAQYTIAPGDSLSKLAELFQVDLKILKQINNLNSNRIIAGKTLLIPGYFGHKVQAGDTVFTLAKKYGIAQNEILRLNGLEDANLIRLDQVLIFPRKPPAAGVATQGPSDARQNPTTPKPQVTTNVDTEKTNDNKRHPTQCVVYTAEKGDSWEKIAKSFNLAPEELKETQTLNAQIASLSPGKYLLIPPTGPHVKFTLDENKVMYAASDAGAEFLGYLKSWDATGIYRPGSENAVALIKAATNSPKRQQALLSILGVEAKLDGVNSYDNGYLSLGFFQWTFHRGEAMQLLLRFKKDFPEDYQKLFVARGLAAENDHTVSILGTAVNIKRHAQTARLALLRSPYFAWVIVEAAKSENFKKTEIAHGLGRFDEREFSTCYEILGANEAQLTDLELALLLNYHIQKPKIMDREMAQANQERERLVAKGLIPKDASRKDWILAIFAVNSMPEDRREKAFHFFAKKPEAKTLLNLQQQYRTLLTQEANEKEKSAKK